MFGIDIKKVALKEVDDAIAKLKAIDVNHNGISDMEELKKEFEVALSGGEAILTILKPGDVERILEILFPGRITPELIAKLENSFAKLVELEPKVVALLLEIKPALGL